MIRKKREQNFISCFGTYKGHKIVRIRLDRYCDELTDEERLDKGIIYKIGNILHYQGYKIGEVVNKYEVIEWYPIETEYSFNSRKKRRIQC